MKKLLAAGLVVLALAGCSAPTIDREAIYLKLVHDNTTNTSTDAKLVDLAHTACDTIKAGASVKDLGWVVAGNGFNAHQRDEVSRILGYGISQYCPQS